MCHVSSDYRLKSWTRNEGAIRLSEDEGPPATEFLGDDYDEDNGSIDDDELPLAERVAQLHAAQSPTAQPAVTT